MEIFEYIYKGVVEPYYKNLPSNMPTILVKAVTTEDNPPHLRLIP